MHDREADGVLVERLVMLERHAARWSRAIALAGLVGLLLLAAATMGDVLLRWIANQPIKGLGDIGELIVVIVIASCFPVVVAQRQNVTIRFLGRGLGPFAERWLDAFGSVLLLAFVALMGWQLVLYTEELVAAGRTTWLLLVPVAPYWIVGTVVFALCIPAQALCAAVDVARAFGGGGPARGGPMDETSSDAARHLGA